MDDESKHGPKHLNHNKTRTPHLEARKMMSICHNAPSWPPSGYDSAVMIRMGELTRGMYCNNLARNGAKRVQSSELPKFRTGHSNFKGPRRIFGTQEKKISGLGQQMV